jgi:plasmid stability protein
MAARVKKRAGTSTDRESDKIIVRLPEGMRHALAELAARNGRSMTAEVVTALAMYFANEGAAKQSELLGVETAIREIAANQQQTLELVRKIIQSPAISRPADDMVDMVDRLDRAIASKK